MHGREKIGYGQLAVVLVLSQLALDMTDKNTSGGYTPEHFLTVLCAYAIMLALFVPLILFARRTDGESVVTLISRRNKILGGCVSVLFIVILLLSAASGFGNLCEYTEATLLDGAGFYIVLVLLAAAAIYAAAKGIEAVVRTGCIIAFIAAVFIIIAVISVAFKMDWTMLYPSFFVSEESFFASLTERFSILPNVVVFAVLTRYVDKLAQRAAVWFTAVSFAAAECGVLLYITVLGPFMRITEYPFHTVASMADIALLQRLDGVDSAIWILCGVIRTALYIFCAADLLSAFLGSKVWCCIGCGSVAALWAVIARGGDNIAGAIEPIFPAVVTIVTVAAAICGLVFANGGKKDEKASRG